MTIEEVQHALEAMELPVVDGRERQIIATGDLYEASLLLTLCAGHAVIDTKSNIIRLAHYTTPKYFERYGTKLFPDAEVKIVSACLWYLILDQTMPGYTTQNASDSQYSSDSVDASESGNSIDDLSESYNGDEIYDRGEKWPFARYASMCWGLHARGDVEIRLSDQIIDFLSSGPILNSACACAIRACEGKSNVEPLGLALWQYPPREESQDLDYEDRDKKFPPLVIAAMWNLKHILNLLLQKKADTNTRDSFGYVPLHYAASNGHVEVIKVLLGHNADPLIAIRGCNMTALDKAVWYGHTQATLQLIRAYKTRKCVYIPGLAAAARRGNMDMLALLLKENASMDEPALVEANYRGNEPAVRLLLDAGIIINATSYGKSAIQTAASRGHKSTVICLLQSGARINTPEQYPLLHAAAEHGRPDMVDLLLEAGANISFLGSTGSSALQAAVRGGCSILLGCIRSEFFRQRRAEQEMLRTGTMINETSLLTPDILQHLSGDGIAPDDSVLDFLVKHFDIKKLEPHETCLKLLVATGVDPNLRNSEGQTCLHSALYKRGNNMVSDIHKSFMWTTARTIRSQRSGYHHGLAAYAYWTQKVMTILLDAKADVNAQDLAGRTPLHHAAESSLGGTILFLIKMGAEINAQDTRRQTPLRLAAGNGMSGFVPLLVKEGADIEAKSIEGFTPLMTAARSIPPK